MLTDAQREARQNGLGGSDAAAVLGISPWKTPLELYLEKTGQALPGEPNDAMIWGNRLEGVVADAAAERLGISFQHNDQTLVHRDYPWMLGHIDREVSGEPTLVEIKTTGYQSDDWGEEGTDAIPPYYLAQVAHYLAVTEYHAAHVAVLFLQERRLGLYFVPRDLELEAHLLDAEQRFWCEHVVPRVPPDPITPADVSKRWPASNGQSVVTTADVHAALTRLPTVKAEQDRLKTERAALEAAIKTHLGAAETLTDPGGTVLATWRNTKPSTKIAWDQVAQQLAQEHGVPSEQLAALVRQHSTQSNGSRQFLLKRTGKEVTP